MVDGDPFGLSTNPDLVRLRAYEIKRELMVWLDRNTKAGDERAVAAALMELAVNQHIEIMGRARAMKHIASMFKPGKW